MSDLRKPKALLLENIHPRAAKRLAEAGFAVKSLPQALDAEALRREIADAAVIGIRSKTKLTDEVLSAAKKLSAVGAFCIGTDQIDLGAAAKRGVAVFNAPYSSARSVVEMVLGEILLLSRGVFAKNRKMHAGNWDKSAAGSHEVRGKTLGIVGYGKIGSQLSVLAEALGMEVHFHDVEEKLVLGNAKKRRSLAELLKISDVVTLHVDGRPGNRGLFGRREFNLMKPGAIFINASRGFVVDEAALAEKLKSGRLRGAALDVFSKEPRGSGEGFYSPLQGIDQAVLTPHVAGSTEEAQTAIGAFVAERLLDYAQTGGTLHSVNFPNIQLPKVSGVHRVIHIHENIPGMLAQINKVFAAHKANIVEQYLKTNESLGYAITDISPSDSRAIARDLAAIKHTIKSRILY